MLDCRSATTANAAQPAMRDAPDIVYALMSIDTYRILRLEQRWSGARYEGWLAHALYRLLVTPHDV